MAQSLPGVPIVGYYSEKKEDFGDHGDQIVIDGDGIKFNCLTRPYGFVAPDSKVWFQEFEDTDDFGNKTLREYLMCEGYLWTEQYEEAKKIMNEGRPQSMELDESTLKGYWSTDNNKGIDFFIINSAIVTKLCTLGEDVEPCFEGASITAPEVSSSFTKDKDKFSKDLFTMIKELKEFTFALKNEGGNSMELENQVVAAESAEAQAQEVENNFEVAVNAEVAENAETVIEPSNETVENFSNPEDNLSSENTSEIKETIEEFKKSEEEEDKADSKEDSNENKEAEAEEDEDKKVKTKNTLEEDFENLNQNFTKLQADYNALKAEYDVLVQFKNNVEDTQKTELINSFSMLSEADKEDVIKNKANYSLDEIKSKLAVICWDKKVNYNVAEETKEVVVPNTFNLNSVDNELPAWLKAVEERKNQNN